MLSIRTTVITRAANGLRLLAVVAFLCAGLALQAPAAQVTATVDRNVVTQGEGLNLTLTFQGVQVPGQPQLPPIPGFDLDASRVSSGFSMINGAVQQSFTYVLVPKSVGDFTIPTMVFQAGGRAMQTQPIQVKVIKAGSSVSGGNSDLPLAFGKVVLSKTNLYVGEMFTIELQLYVHASRRGGLQSVGKVFEDGFRLSEFRGPSRKDVQFKGQPYRMDSYVAVATVVKAGTFDSGPVAMQMAFTRPSFFGESIESQHRLAADPVVVQVSSVPTASAPPNYSGALGNFALSVAASPTNIAVGDPITVRAVISGRGQFESLSLPAQPDWREFKTYAPTSVLVTNDGIGIACTKTFEQVVIPQNHEVKFLPPFRFTFFDPDAKQFRVLSGPPIPLHVRPGVGTVGPLPTLAGLTNKSEQPEKQPEIATIKVHLDAPERARRPLFQQGWFLGLQAVPPVVWLSLLIRRRQAESLARNPRLLRQRQVARVVEEGMRQLNAAAGGNKSDEFFATLFRLLQEQIGERLDLPATAITEAVVEEKLRPLGVQRETLHALQSLFQECNLARYAPARGKGELGAMIPKVQSVLEALKQLPQEGRK